jgi:hypothetical protein
VSPADAGARTATGGALATCARCGAGVALPANFCDMCGSRFTPPGAADRRDRSATAAGQREGPLGPPGATVSAPRRPMPEPEAGAGPAHRALASAYRTLKNIERTAESIEAPASDGSVARRLLNMIASRREDRIEIPELRPTLEIARKEAGKAAELDPDSVVETEDGPLNARALLALADRVEGGIDLLAGNFHDAVRHYQSSIERRETRDAYLDMAFAYERMGQPGKALAVYERCSALKQDGETDMFAGDEAERLRSKMIMGGWFVGSWIVVGGLAYLAVLSLLSLLIFPVAGKVALAACVAGLGVYFLAQFRRPVRAESPTHRPSEIA